MGTSPIWLTEADVTASIDLVSAIDTLEDVLVAEISQQAANMPKTHLMVGENNAMHALGGAIHSLRVCGTKTWVNIDGKSSTMILLFSLVDGSCLAAIESTALGQIRTAAMSGLGTRWLSDTNVTEMAIIGTGKQALPQIAACVAVRPLSVVKVFSRQAKKRQALVSEINIEFPDIEVVNCDNLKEATRDVPLITLCTNSTVPFFNANMASQGAHINAVGAIVPSRVEFTEDVLMRCTTVAVDTLVGVQKLSQEFISHYENGDGDWNQVLSMSQVIHERYERPLDTDLTLFKPMGMGIADIAIAKVVLDKNLDNKKVHTLPERQRQKLPLVGVK